MNLLKRAAAAFVLGGGLTAGVLVATAGVASADYGQGTTYQVELSANAHGLTGPVMGAGLWFWAALSPGGSVDYQETDCGHVPGQGSGAAHNTTGTASWSDNHDGTLTIRGVETFFGPISITVPDTYGHYTYSAPDPVFTGFLAALPSQVQVAP